MQKVELYEIKLEQGDDEQFIKIKHAIDYKNQTAINDAEQIIRFIKQNPNLNSIQIKADIYAALQCVAGGLVRLKGLKAGFYTRLSGATMTTVYLPHRGGKK